MARKSKADRKGISPYVKYAKAPFQYSSEYYEWRAALKTTDQGRINKARAAHNRRFGLFAERRFDLAA